MNGKLIELPTEKLLEKFGAGNHKPGSGSAAALQGLLSAQLILTVIDLTSDGKRISDYQSILAQLSVMSSDINTRIYPRLQKLFQQDSEQFDSAIQLRIARDNEKGFKRRTELDQQAKDALKLAIETPIEVAKLCVELADFAIFIFNNAFKSARGDSGVALNSAVAVVAGCLSIIELNLLSIDDEEWIKKIKLATKELKLQYERLLSLANNSLLVLEIEVEVNQSLQNEIKKFQTNKLNKPNLSNNDIEEVARKAQIILWNYRNTIWKKKKPENPREILKPHVAFEKLLNYRVIKRETLGTYDMSGESIEIAGIIDNGKKAVGISKKFSSSTQNFTLAHELGHALLHKQTVLHRDRAMDGSSGLIAREPIEYQADKFASYFLMPEKQVKKLFQEIFLIEKFFPNEDNVFALTGGSLSSFRSNCRNLRELSRIIASAESLYGNPFKSMAEVFNVSIGAMAIRLEELGLVEFESAVKATMSF
jgi:formiminotetrahydrofolate cyclodeaminase/Zn-dependent peptidase ImmA (M78 family)